MATTHQTSSGATFSSSMAYSDGELDVAAGFDTEVPWFELERRARRRRIITFASVACALLLAVIAAALWNANAHYERGAKMLASGRDAAAVEEFAAARFFTLPFRDAAALKATAQRSLSATMTAAASVRHRDATVKRLLEKADTKLATGDAAGVFAAVAEARRVVPDGPLASGSPGLAAGLAARIQAVAARDLAHGGWNRAVRLATAWLAVLPADVHAAEFLARARADVALQARLVKARVAAAHGRWREARRLARAILRAHKGFPGAAAIVIQARVALAPKPKPKPAPKPAVATQPAATSTGAATTPAAPPPP